MALYKNAIIDACMFSITVANFSSFVAVAIAFICKPVHCSLASIAILILLLLFDYCS